MFIKKLFKGNFTENVILILKFNSSTIPLFVKVISLQ